MTSFLCEIITVDRALVLLEVVVIGIAAYFAYKVGKKQNQINQNLLSLHLVPSLLVTCDLPNERIVIANKGGSNVYIWGVQEDDKEPKIEDTPRLITPGSLFYLTSDNLINWVKEQGANQTVALKTFISSLDEKKYIHKTSLIFEFEEDELTNVRTQSFPPEDWLE